MSELNFSSLFTENGGPDQGPQQKPTESPQNAIEQQQAPTLYRQAQQTQEAQKREADIRKEYAENTRKTEHIKNNIMKGIQQGADPFTLLYWALQGLGITTHDTLFYEQTWQMIDAMYGVVLAEPEPLERQIEAARERLEKIRAAIVLEPQEGPRSIMERALKEHEALISRLEEKKESKGGKVESLRYDTAAGEFVPV